VKLVMVGVEAEVQQQLAKVPRGRECDIRIVAAVDPAIELLRTSAFDLVMVGPCIAGLDRLLAQAKRNDLAPTVLRCSVRQSASSDRTAIPSAASGPMLIGESCAIRNIRRLITRMAANDATVLLTGESGTGKDVAARLIHATSPRSAGPFIVVNCAAVPEALLESELFGHERGAFTDARESRIGLVQSAHGGTIFLDEIGDMPLGLQAKLLRLLEDRAFRRLGASCEVTIDVRVVAATNVDLLEAVQRGRFRQDLYYRLAVLELSLPPLRERDGDVVLLARHFFERFARQHDTPIVRIDEGVWTLLAEHCWPGNVRELRNVVERTVLMLESDVVAKHDVLMPVAVSPPGRVELPPEGISLAGVERALLLQAVDRAKGNFTIAGRLLGLHRDQVRYRLNKYGVPARRRGGSAGNA
jgi:transcriptional regulator with PAS, ATPase and Fis domain